MNVFITRNIKATDFFKTALEEVGFVVFGESLIEFSPVLFDEMPDCDWLFFYSKNGVRFFFNQLNSRQLENIKNKKIGAIGEGTANFLTKYYQIQPNFIGTGEPSQTSKAFGEIATGQRVIFPRAKQSKKSIQTHLSGVARVIDLVVYANKPKQIFSTPPMDILVFTSPMNTQAYFKKYALQPHQQVIAIGNTTANELRKIGLKDLIIAQNPSEEGLVTAVLEI